MKFLSFKFAVLLLATLFVANSYSHSSYESRNFYLFRTPHVHHPVCLYPQSSSCNTYTGTTCPLIVNHVHNFQSLISRCLIEAPFYLCLQDLVQQPVVTQELFCTTIGTPCYCDFGLINGYYYYELGVVQ